LTVHVGTLEWVVDPDAATINAAGTVTAVDGEIDVHALGQDCIVTVSIPDANPVPITATGTLQASGDVLVPDFTEVTVDDTNVNLVSAPGVCTTVAAAAQAEFQSGFATSLLEELNARANSLRCLDCRSDCPGGVACL
jgi:hypothetical protein